MKKIGRGAVILPMMIITIATQVLVMFKSSIVASMFGVSSTVDAYHFANSIATFLFGFLMSGISSIVLPEYGKNNDIRKLNTFITVLYMVLGGLIAAIVLLRYPLVEVMSGREEVEFIEVAANSLIILLISQLMASVSSITVAYFQCKEKFLIPKIIQLVSQTIVVIALLLLPNLSILEYVLVLTAGVALNFIFDTVLAMRCGWRFKPACFFDDETKLLFKCFIPILISAGIYNLSHLVDSVIATFLQTGGITILSYSSQISTIVNTVITSNLLTYIYPKTIKNINQKGPQKFFWDNTVLMHTICCLMITGFFTVGKEGVILLLNHGHFTMEQCEKVFIGAFIYICGQQTNCVRTMIYQYFYAVGDTKTPARNSIAVTIMNLVFSFALVSFIGFYGIILGTILASFVSTVMIFVHFGKKIGFDIKILSVIKRMLMNVVISILTMAIILMTRSVLHIDNFVLQLFIFGFETIILYCGIQWVFNHKFILNTMKKL